MKRCVPLHPILLPFLALAGTLLCRVECGFGTGEGLYRFTASADGHEPRTLAVPAAYAELDGGCPSRNAGSTPVVIELTATP